MRGKLCHCLLLAGFASLAGAQSGAPSGPYQPDRVDALIERLHGDLSNGFEHWHLSDADHKRLSQAEKRLRGFATDLRQTRFDKADLSGAIDTVASVLDRNRLSGPDRSVLLQDLDAFRAIIAAYERHDIGVQ